jgi:hypothetical protein
VCYVMRTFRDQDAGESSHRDSLGKKSRYVKKWVTCPLIYPHLMSYLSPHLPSFMSPHLPSFNELPVPSFMSPHLSPHLYPHLPSFKEMS